MLQGAAPGIFLTSYCSVDFTPLQRRGLLRPLLAAVGWPSLTILRQHALYATLGYVFGDTVSRRLWISGFKASQSLLGLLLFPVTALLLLFPAAIELLLSIAAVLYALVRIVFVFKGLRIFFNKFSQSLYFILYLCSVEIVPLVIFAMLLVAICTQLQS